MPSGLLGNGTIGKKNYLIPKPVLSQRGSKGGFIEPTVLKKTSKNNLDRIPLGLLKLHSVNT